ncbi:hypothetical protein M3Y96_01139100 [Aphelenchoides besseyi]|nr:hypothetical protein M3Y96_01139100 [Aphelenchoides besseyi]
MESNQTSTTTLEGYHYGGSSTETAVGFAVLFFGCASFGTMFIPLKFFDCSDGFFVQFVECAAVFVYGVVINVIRKTSQFNLIAAIGGALYATGNCASIPIIQSELGVGLGMLVWSSVQVIEGWCIGRFGLLGTHVQRVQSEAMNYSGLILSILSGFLFVFVKSEKSEEQKQTNGNRGFISRTKIFYLGLSIFLGCLHGLMLTPVVYVQENDPHFTGNVLDYMFSFFCGVFFFSTIYFAVYAAIKKNKPVVRPELVLPSILYGIIWATGMTCFIVSNAILSQTITWPITARLPAIIGCLIDVVFFKTIKGRRNFTILGLGILVGVVGVVLVGLSNQF